MLEKADSLRRSVVEELEKRESEVTAFVEEWNAVEGRQVTFEEYVTKMAVVTTWGGVTLVPPSRPLT